ncbi:helix-turn-helix domain-containing protein [Flagellimonas nanhaiensis]|uniref:AraC family transcriptional regulator n=1 Tax=Flagellimonas nanhaiensis TaxID=2292706 RepID=A0A371JPG0_9FLAO|nr:helix-turn-helix domain-containing protein [Allomuricauda nanhaiensis]RDY59399.1 AraC family transcriptional regulator [Allomuricauda nanhaiensis]
MQSERLYLQKSINIGVLAKKLDTNSKYISQAINHELGKSFTDFLNGYRVEEAKKQLLDQKNNNLTLEAIGTMAGFGSKSAFFGAFKKHTGQTPSQFLEENKK